MAIGSILKLSFILATLTSMEMAKIAIVPFGVGGSHFMVLKSIGHELERRGHRVVFVVSDYYPDKTGYVFPHRIYDGKVEPAISKLLDTISGNSDNPRVDVMLKRVWNVVEVACRSLLLNEDAMAELKSADLLITESAFFTSPLIAEAAGVPRVDFASAVLGIFDLAYGIPMPPSYVPDSNTLFTDRMNFWQRVMNYAIKGISQGLTSFYIARELRRLQLELQISPHKLYEEISMTPQRLIIQSHFAVEFVHPVPPHVHYVGPILPKRPEPLTEELEDFMQSAGSAGVVVIAFGSYLDDGPAQKWEELTKALSTLPQKFIWKTTIHHSKLSSNIKSVDWLPQNDLLGHKQTKAFISHAGHNSAYEAAYHGVPVVAAPAVNDQASVAHKMATRAKMAVVVDVHSADASTWVWAIQEVIGNPDYKGNATRVSQLLQGQPTTPTRKAASVIEQALREALIDPNYLHHPGLGLGFFTRHSYDVLAFLVLGSLLLAGIVLLCTVALFKRLLRCHLIKSKAE